MHILGPLYFPPHAKPINNDLPKTCENSTGQSLIHISNIKFHLNQSNGSQVDRCGRTDRQKWWIQRALFATKNWTQGVNESLRTEKRRKRLRSGAWTLWRYVRACVTDLLPCITEENMIYYHAWQKTEKKMRVLIVTCMSEYIYSLTRPPPPRGSGDQLFFSPPHWMREVS